MAAGTDKRPIEFPKPQSGAREIEPRMHRFMLHAIFACPCTPDETLHISNTAHDAVCPHCGASFTIDWLYYNPRDKDTMGPDGSTPLLGVHIAGEAPLIARPK